MIATAHVCGVPRVVSKHQADRVRNVPTTASRCGYTSAQQRAKSYKDAPSIWEICSARLEIWAMASTVPLLSMDDGRRLGQFAKFFRVDPTTFKLILNKVGPLISKQHTSMSIPGHRAVYDRPTLRIQARYEIYS